MPTEIITQREVLRRLIGARFDYPSVYMGGTSERSKRKADDVILSLQEYGFLPPDDVLDAPFTRPVQEGK